MKRTFPSGFRAMLGRVAPIEGLPGQAEPITPLPEVP
jgi:hypothetical protein